jgi:hypothetical protein
MDYARFNYVAQPEDGVTNFSTHWDYDKWAIKWGYSYFPAKTAKEEKGILNEMTKEAYKTVAFGLELKLVHTIHVIKQRILEIMLWKHLLTELKIFKGFFLI